MLFRSEICKLAIFVCLLAGTLVFTHVSHAEDVSDGAQSPTLENGALVNEIDLPSDIQTRESFQDESIGQTNLGPTGSQYLQFFFALLFVIAIIYALSWFLKRFMTAGGLVAGSSESLKVVSTLSLTPARTLYLIRLGNKLLLLGAGEGGLRTLSEISDRKEISEILKEVEHKGNFDLNPFKQKFQTLTQDEIRDFEGLDNFESRQRKIKSSLDRLRSTTSNDK